ncbi:ATP synthase F1 subunit epsilon [Microgenomates group bacterium RIFCSPLOWO2_01_FULL_47_10]|nr:MAG: ATP synthase F1 subunit epsilon [Microgenomates group bacterium RIFCSPLOWO2_01_FULL_47_10]
MAPVKLTLQIITQESHLLTDIVDSVTAPTVMGEITILPHHISLFTRLDAGEVRYTKAGKEIDYVVSGGFMEVSGGNTVTILADSAIHADEINIAKAEAAKQRAESLLKEKTSQRDLLLAEADLRRAMMEIKVAKKRRRN